MVKVKIEWTIEARLDLLDILEFYLQRNGNSIYSKKLYTRINDSVKLLAKNPFLGKQTEDTTIRALVTGDYQIIYEVFEKLILIVMIWNCRRDPTDKVIDLRKK
jgi:plasmid stabilization system protein ParE